MSKSDIKACRPSGASSPTSSSPEVSALDANSAWARAKSRSAALEKFLEANQRWLDRFEQRMSRH
ncbi:MAG: hypothetical protein ACLPGW_18850 [Roseiarcus sp.]